jgi:hypothetical protein
LGSTPELEGDGVRFEMHVVDREVRTRVVNEALEPGAPPMDLRVPLDPWADRSVLFRVGVEPNESSDYDWSRIERLEIVPCASADLAIAVQRNRATVENAEAHASERDLFLHPNGLDDPPARVVIPARPERSSCLFTELAVTSQPGQGDGVTFVVDLVDEGEEHPLFSQYVPPGTTSGPHRAVLRRWAGRDIQVRLATLPFETADYDWAHFVAPRIAPCEDE